MANKKKRKQISIIRVIVISFVLSVISVLCLEPALRALYPLKYQNEIEMYSKKFDIDKYLIMGVISSESAFDENAKSHKSAHGLMQLKDDTALWTIENLNLNISPDSIRNPADNIHIGCAYLDYLIELYDGNVVTAIAAYNAGLGNVNRWLSDKRYSDGRGTLTSIPFLETKDYVTKVQKRAKIYNRLYKER